MLKIKSSTKLILVLLFTICHFLFPHLLFAADVRINEIRADDYTGDDAEFIELIGKAGTVITGMQIVHYNGSATSDGGLWTHTIPAFTIQDEGITDTNGNALGFYVVGDTGVSNVDDTGNGFGTLQNGPDGIVLYDTDGTTIIDAVAWQGAGDMTDDDPGTVITTAGHETDANYLHVTADDSAADTCLQAPNNVNGDDGSGWAIAAATPGAINSVQTTGNIITGFAAVGAPAVTTNDASLVEEITATLSGNITGLGGAPSCDERGFDWDIDTGAPYANNWTETGTYGTGEFTHGLISLTKGELYYYRAKAHNTTGWGYGDEVTFLTQPDPPTSFTATTKSCTQIDLEWANGTGGDGGYIEHHTAADDTWEPGDHTEIPADGYATTPHSHTGLSPNTAYYYKIWSYAEDDSTKSDGSVTKPYGDSPAIDNATTSAVGDVVINEIFSDTNTSDTEDECVELYNKGTTDIDTSGWYLKDNLEFNDTYSTWDLNKDNGTISKGDALSNTTILRPGWYAIFLDPDYAMEGTVGQPYSFQANNILLTTATDTTLGNGLGNTGDNVDIYKSDNSTLVDAHSFGASGDGSSWERNIFSGTSWTTTAGGSIGSLNTASSGHGMTSLAKVDIAASDISPNDTNVTVLAVTVPDDNGVADTLIGCRLENAGTMVDTTDVAAVKVWKDVDENNAYTAGTDAAIGTLSYVTKSYGSFWHITDASQNNAIGIGGQKIVFTIDVASGATNGRTFKARLPKYNGLMVESGYHGPTDATVTNANFQTVSAAVTAPIIGYTADNVIPAAQMSQATDGSGNVTITYKVKDPNAGDTIDVKNGSFSYQVNSGDWNTIADANISGTKGNLNKAADWSGSNNTLTWASKTAIDNVESSNVQIKFKVNDGTADSAEGVSATGFNVDNLKPAISVATNITTDPITAGSTTIAMASTWTETNDSGGSTASSFDAAINGGASYIGEQAGTASKTATIASYPIGETLDGADYISKVQSKLTDYYGNVSSYSEVISNTYVKPYQPQAPAVTNTTASNTLYVNVTPHASEVAAVKYAIYCSATSPTDSNWLDKYVAADGSASAIAVWRTDATWGTATVTGLLENTQYTFKVQATNPNNEGTTVSVWSGTNSKYTLLDPPTDGELTVSPHATNPTIMDTISVATPPNSTAGTTSALFTVMTGSDLGAGPHGWTNGQYSYSDTGLIANTQYGWKVKYRNGNSAATTETAEKTAYTLAKAPSKSASTTIIQQVTCTRSISPTWYGSADGNTFTFSTADGFGVGTVQSFKYVWDTNASTDPSGGTTWDAGTGTTLPLNATSDSSSWYLHLKSYNADGVGNPALLHFGAFKYDGTAPTSVTISGVSESADNLHYKGTTFYYSNNQSMHDPFTITVTASDACSNLQKCVGESAFGGEVPDDTSYDGGFQIVYYVDLNETGTSPLTMTVYDNANNTAPANLTIQLDNTAPDTITGFSATGSDASSVSLSWDVLGVGPSGFSTYEIWYSKNSGIVAGEDNLWDETDEAALSLYTTTSATVTGLSPSTTYYFNIDGLDNVKNRGALVASDVEKATTSGATKDIKINEILMNNSAAQPEEWVELYNSGTTAHDLNGWQLRDKAASLHNFNSSLIMNPGDYLVIYAGDWTGSDDDDMSDGKGEIKGNAWLAAGDLADGEDAVQLYDNQSTFSSTTIADFVWYGVYETDDPGTVDDNAVAAEIWPIESITYRSLDGMATPTDRPAWLYRDGSTPTEKTRPNTDWDADAAIGTDTPGGPNQPPTAVTSVAFKNEAFDTDVTTADLGDNLYIELIGTDADASHRNTCLVKLTSDSDSTGVRITLIETTTPGTYRSLTGTGAASVNSATSYATDTIGAAGGDTVTVTSIDDGAKYDTLSMSGGETKISITNWRELY